MKPSPGPSPEHFRSGLLFALACYGIWGLLPLYFLRLEYASALEIVAHRAVWTLLLCLLILAGTRALPQFVAALRQPRQFGFLAAAAGLIGCNWLLYVHAATHREVLQASLGYFLNPLLTVLLGVMVLRERLRPGQWLAMGIAAAAVLVIALGYGRPPWIAAGLAVSFALYGLAKSFAGRTTGAVASLAVETLLLAPPALAVLYGLHLHGQSHFATRGVGGMLLLASTGIITAAPLTCFAAATRRLPLSVVGMLQYLAPSLQFLIAVAVNHEPMPPSRWAGFGLTWLALLALSADAWRARRAGPPPARVAATVTGEA